jgi:hypothetical protein
VPYANGDVPVVGDYVRNQWDQPGTVLEVCLAGADFPHDHISVRWDDGGDDLPLTPAIEFTLVSRPSQIIADSTPENILDGSAETILENSQVEERTTLEDHTTLEERTTRLAVVPEIPPPFVVVACSICKGVFYWPHSLGLPAYCPHCGAKHMTTSPQT